MSTLKTNNIQHVDRSDPSIIINTDGSVSIAGTLTYEDVTSVDSVGIITARSGINATGGNITFGDSSDGSSDDVLKFGASSDLSLFHNGTDSRIVNTTGDLSIRGNSLKLASTTGEEYVRCTANGSVDLFYDNVVKLNTNSDGYRSNDNVKAQFGNESDLNIYHNGTHSFVQDSGTGNLMLAASAFQVTNAAVSETMIYAVDGGAVNLYHNNVKKLETVSTGTQVVGDLTFSGATSKAIRLNDNKRIYFGDDEDFWIGSNGTNGEVSGSLFYYNHQYYYDNVYARFGNGTDLSIFHNGTNSFISNTTGILQIDSDDRVQVNATEFRIKNAGDTELIAKFIQGGAIELYHANTLKLNTSSAGVTIQNGHLVMNRQDTGNEGGEIVFNRASDNSGQWVNDVYGNDSSARLRWHNGGVEKLNLLTTGNVEIPNGNLVIGTAGKGIDFSAAPNVGGMDNELFDDYEEGTFTMTMAASTSGTISLTTVLDSLRYTKIGNVVFIHGRIRVESVSSPVGGLQIGGLPYAAIGSNTNSQDGYQHFAVNTHGVNFHNSTVQVFGELAPNATGAGIFSMFDNSNWAILDASLIQGNANEYFGFTFFYHTST